MVMVMVMSTPLQELHSREEEGEKAKHCQQKLQENVWKVNISETSEKPCESEIFRNMRKALRK